MEPEPFQLFSYISEIDITTLNTFNDRDLLSLCQVNKYTASLCNNNDLWIRRIKYYFDSDALKIKPDDISWRQHYFNLVDKVILDSIYYARISSTSGNLRILRLLKDYGFEYFDAFVSDAAESNHPEVLLWMLENSVAPAESILVWAIEYGFIDLLILLANRGILPDQDTLAMAAGNGDLWILQFYAYNYNLLPDKNAAIAAKHEDQEDVLEWLSEKGIYPE
jgi:hypothetical protein